MCCFGRSISWHEASVNLENSRPGSSDTIQPAHSNTWQRSAQHGMAQPPFHQGIGIVFTQSSSLFEDTTAVGMMLLGRPASSKQSTTVSPIISSPPSLHGPIFSSPGTRYPFFFQPVPCSTHPPRAVLQYASETWTRLLAWLLNRGDRRINLSPIRQAC